MHKAEPGAPIFLPDAPPSRVFTRRGEADTAAALVQLGYTPECARACAGRAGGRPRLASEYAYHALHSQAGTAACVRCPECSRRKMASFNDYVTHHEDMWGQSARWDPFWKTYAVEPARTPLPKQQKQQKQQKQSAAVVHVSHHHHHQYHPPPHQDENKARASPQAVEPPPPAYSPPKLVPRYSTRGLMG